MDRLSSCYFCGTAVDAPLEDYPVVPGAVSTEEGGDGLVVTLCPTCRRKLATIVERVVAAEGKGVAGEGEAGSGGVAVDADGERGDDAGIAESAGPETGGGTGDVDDPDPAGDPVDGSMDDGSVSVLEYNRVMRLLENRELPVERIAFRELATSAYELSPGTVDAVIDAAIDGRLLDEDEEGRLVRSPDRGTGEDDGDCDDEPTG